MNRKFYLSAVLALCLLFGGCNKQTDFSLDFEGIKEDISELKEDEWNFANVPTEVVNEEKEQVFGELEEIDVYSEGFETRTTIPNGIVEKAFFFESADKQKAEGYIVIKAYDGKESELEKGIKTYFEKRLEEVKGDDQKELINKRLESKVEDCNVYIVSSDNAKVLSRIKEAKSRIFGMLLEVGEEQLEDVYGFSTDEVDEYLITQPMVISTSSYIIVKPKDGFREKVENAIDNYMTEYEKQWESYLPYQYELVKNRLKTTYGDYLIYIISEDNDATLEAIKANTLVDDKK